MTHIENDYWTDYSDDEDLDDSYALAYTDNSLKTRPQLAADENEVFDYPAMLEQFRLDVNLTGEAVFGEENWIPMPDYHTAMVFAINYPRVIKQKNEKNEFLAKQCGILTGVINDMEKQLREERDKYKKLIDELRSLCSKYGLEVASFRNLERLINKLIEQLETC